MCTVLFSGDLHMALTARHRQFAAASTGLVVGKFPLGEIPGITLRAGIGELAESYILSDVV